MIYSFSHSFRNICKKNYYYKKISTIHLYYYCSLRAYS